jgi:LacI family transcriptional regulator
MKKPSLKDIARELGVSTALVSYVLNGKRLNRVSVELADRIRNKAAELNYQADLIARSMKTRKTMTLGLLLPDIANPFFGKLASAIQAEAGRRGYAVLMGSAGEDVTVFAEVLHRFMDRPIDGLILSPVAESIELVRPLQHAGIPVVLVDRFFPEMSLSAVSVDHYRAAFQAVSHLIDQGCKRIGMLSYESALFLIHERERGFRDALAARGLQFHAGQLQRIRYHAMQDTIGPAMDRLLVDEDGNAPDGLFFVANLAATAGIRHLNRRRIRIPDQMAVISFDENEASALFYAPISFMRQPIADIAAESVRLILDAGSSPRQVLLPAELVIQASSQPTVGRIEG